MPSDFGTGGGGKRGTVKKAKPQKKYTLPTPSTGRGDSPSQKRQDTRAGAKVVARVHGSRQHYWDRVAAAEHHPRVKRADAKVKEAARAYHGPWRSQIKSEKLEKFRKAHAAREDTHRKTTDPVAQREYNEYLDRLYQRVAGRFGPTQPTASFHKLREEGADAQVERRDADNVKYDRNVPRDYMQVRVRDNGRHMEMVDRDEPGYGKGRGFWSEDQSGKRVWVAHRTTKPKLNRARIRAEQLPLHEWVHTRQKLPPWRRDDVGIEGGAVALARRIAKNIGMREVMPEAPEYLDYLERYRRSGRNPSSEIKRRR